MVTVLSTTQGLGHGAETVLCEMLNAWPANGLPLRIAAPRVSRVIACAADLGFPTVPLASRHDALAGNAAAVFRAFRRNDGISLVHAWSARGFEQAWWLKHRFGIPASGTLHDHPQACFHGACRKRVMKWAANRLDSLAVVSEAVAVAASADGYRMPLQVIRNGLIDGLVQKRTGPVLRIGFLGMYAAWKGRDIVASWIESMLPLDGVRWHLYGNALLNAKDKVSRLAEQSPGHVELKGVHATKAIFSEIDVLVHASTNFDPLPTVLIEAARAGIPCVASRLGGAAEIVIDGQTGLLFDPAVPMSGLAALKILVSDPHQRSRMGLAARRRFEDHFKAGTMASGYQRFWAQLLARQTGKG